MKIKSIDMFESGKNSARTNALAMILSWGSIDTTDSKQMAERFKKYVEFCIENDICVTNKTCYMALGINDSVIRKWKKDRNTPEDILQFMNMMEAFLSANREQSGVNGELNPVTLVWLQKNYDGMKDTQELIVQQEKKEEYSIEEIRQRYLPK